MYAKSTCSSHSVLRPELAREAAASAGNGARRLISSAAAFDASEQRSGRVRPERQKRPGKPGALPNVGGYGGPFRSPPRSNIEVERELPRMRTQPHRVDLVLALVVDPRLDHVRREDVALQQPVVALLEVVEHDVERAGQLLDLLRLGRRQLVEVLVHRLARIDLVGDAIEPGHDAG